MEGLHPFISFNGNCEEALRYYKEKLHGNIISLMHFEESPMDVPPEFKKKVMFAEFRFGNHAILASDTQPGKPVHSGNNISLSVGTTNLEQTESWFQALSHDGKVHMPMQKTFWGAHFGMLTDKYGIQWMFNCETSKK